MACLPVENDCADYEVCIRLSEGTVCKCDDNFTKNNYATDGVAASGSGGGQSVCPGEGLGNRITK